MPLDQSQRDDWAVQMCKAVRDMVGKPPGTGVPFGGLVEAIQVLKRRVEALEQSLGKPPVPFGQPEASLWSAVGQQSSGQHACGGRPDT